MKTISTLFFLGLSISCFGQQLKITPNGLRNADEPEKTYVVIEIPNFSAKELYDNAIKYINRNYKSPEDVLKGNIDGEFLSYDTYVSEICSITQQGISKVVTRFSAEFKTELNFRDGRVKYEILSLKMEEKNGHPLTFTGSGITSWYIYHNKKGLKWENLPGEIESYFNNTIANLAKSLSGESDDEW